MEASMQAPGSSYPVRFSVEYPDRKLNRLTTAFRIIVAIPIFIVAAAVDGETYGAAASTAGRSEQEAAGFSSLRPCC
jgi:hypothetical protein